MQILKNLEKIKANRAVQRKNWEIREEEFKKIKTFALLLKKLSQDSVWLSMVLESDVRKQAWDSLCAFIKEKDFFNIVHKLFGPEDDVYERGGALKDIWDRISREYITISVMGPISAGKSLLLQLITGLGDDVIPVSADTCTAACTTFINDPRKIASVEFLSESEVKATLMEHIELLNAHLINTNQQARLNGVLTVETAINNSLDELIAKIRNFGYLNSELYSERAIAVGAETTLGSSIGYFKTVLGYCTNFDSYASYIGAGNMLLTEHDILSGELKQFVSYDDNGCTVAFAVKTVTIYWPLNLGEENIGQIRLQDTMGVGEAKIGVTKNLVKSLRDDSDIAIALCPVKQSQALSQDVNTRTFIQVMKEAVDGREPDQWIYYLLNKYAHATTGDVNRTKEQLRQALVEGNVAVKLPETNFSAVDFLAEDGTKNYDGIADYFSSSILANIANNISKIDDFFVEEAQSILSGVMDAYNEIVRMFASFPIPSCETEAHIKTVLKQVQEDFFKMYDINTSYESEIQEALIAHLNDYPLGSFVAMSLGDEDARNKIEVSTSNCQPHELKEKEFSVAQDFILSLLTGMYTDNHFRSGYAFTYFSEVFRCLEDFMGDDIEAIINQTEVVNKVSDVKDKIGELFISKGKLSFVNSTAKGWLNAFIAELKKQEGDYPNLIAWLERFLAEDIDLKKNVIDTIRHLIHKIVSGYHHFGNQNVIHDYNSWIQAMSFCLVHKENRFSNIVINEFSEQIGKDIQMAQDKFFTCANDFMVGPRGLLPKSQVLDYPLVNAELLKFYKSNYIRIFDGDEYAKKLEAISAAKSIQETYCK